MHPVSGERDSSERLGLNELVLVMRKDEIEPTAVDVEMFPQVLHAHGRAFDMPAGPTRTPGALPQGLAGLRALPERKVSGVSLQRRGLDARSREQLLGVAMAQLAVLGSASHVE